MKLLALPLAAALAAAPGAAQTDAPSHPANVPTSSAPDAPICTDRPTKSNFACTVPEGRLQLETDLFNWTRTTTDGARADQYLFTNPTLKYGLGPSTDIEVNWVPYQRIETRVGNARSSIDGVGDVYLRLKQRLTPASGKLQFSLLPYLKAPTARAGIGNREWEGGLIAPVNYSLPGNVTLTVVPEADILADLNNPRSRHLQFQGVINLGFQLTSKTTLYTELWTAQNFDPAGTVRQYSTDVAVAYLIRPTLQLDVGGNFGLNRATPDAQLYLGVSTRF